MKLRIVLDRPKNPENVGAVLRLAANFGVEGVTLVSPCELNERTIWTARHADEYLSSVRTVATLEEAIADCRWAVAFASDARALPVSRRLALPDLPPRLADLPWSEGDILALVFGTEADGLTWDDCQKCPWLVRIPLPAYGVLNLSHAVALALYTLSPPAPAAVAQPVPYRLATRIEMERMYTLLGRVLEGIGFTNPRTDGPPVPQFRLMHARNPLTETDVKTWMKFLSRIEHKIGKPADR